VAGASGDLRRSFQKISKHRFGRAQVCQGVFVKTDIATDVLIVGTGPAGSATAALLSTYGISNMVVNRYGWLANTPRAHITNQRTMEVLRDLGREVEDEAYMFATPQELMGENIFCESLAGEEIGRMKAWGNHPLSRAEHLMSSPTRMNDLPQTFMEPLLFKTACSRGTQARMSTEYLRHEQDGEGVTTTLLDRLTERELTVRSKYLVGADGGKSLVAEHAGLPFEGRKGVAGSMNILFRADLSRYVAHRPSVLYWVMQPGADIGGIGMGLVRMVRPWDEWLIVWGYDINGEEPEISADFATGVARQLVGDPDLEIELLSANTWAVNDYFATRLSNGRVFCAGDAIHRHPPSNGLGSNTSIQDAFNLAWKLALVLRGQAGEPLLDSYNDERAPIARQIVTRANRSIAETGPIFEALGMAEGVAPGQMQQNLEARVAGTSKGEDQREAIRRAIAFKKYEFDAHGVEMNHRYRSERVVTDGQIEPALQLDADLHYQPTTWPGARLPHVWLYRRDNGSEISTLDLCGHGRLTLLTGLGGEPWVAAAQKVASDLGIEIVTHVIGPRQAYVDHSGEWARASEIRDSGCLLVRPDHHVCWRTPGMSDAPRKELLRVVRQVLAR
jgi:2,4-dichlorophenol 6-monooxygenase